MHLIYKLKKNFLQPLAYAIKAIVGKLPEYTINLGNSGDPYDMSWYQYLTKKSIFPLSLLSNKKIAMALIDLHQFHDFETYRTTIKGKNSPDYYSRKALKFSYSFSFIDPNEYLAEIYKINTSSTYRQGKKMNASYLDKPAVIAIERKEKYFGIFSAEKVLVAYIRLSFPGEVVFFSKMLGHKDHLDKGVMYLVFFESIRYLFNQKNEKSFPAKYLIYDTFLMNSEGLALFKKRFGFKPAIIRWKIS